jgi:monoamine oxidase
MLQQQQQDNNPQQQQRRRPPFFEPELSDEKRKAIALTKMGCYKKVFLTFDRIFWPVEPPFIGMVRAALDDCDDDEANVNPLGNYLLLDNLWASRLNVPALEAVLFGKSGEWARNESDEVIRDVVLDFIQDAMGLREEQGINLHDCCQSCHVTRWEEDPFSRGAYSSMALGALERHKEELRRPEWEGRLIFAGEATISEYEGSVHAALFSGTAAAEKANALLLKDKERANEAAAVV